MTFRYVKQKKWEEITEEAMFRLRKPRTNNVIEYFIEYSFQNPVCIQVIGYANEHKYLIVKIVWKKKEDLARYEELAKQTGIEEYYNREQTNALANWLRPKIEDFAQIEFVPEIEVVKKTITQMQYEKLINLVNDTQLPLQIDNRAGLDGNTYTFSLKNYFFSISYTWWSDMPESWQTLAAIIAEMKNLLDNN